MATQRTPDALARWLAAEQAGQDDAAEAALFELIEDLPPVTPPAGFADRVMARWALESPVASAVVPAAAVPIRKGAAPVWARFVLAFGLLSAAAVFFVLPAVLIALGALTGSVGSLSLAELLQAGVRGLSGASQAMASLVGLGQALATAFEALTPSLATPRLAGAVALCLAVSAASFRFLRELISRERSWAYVDPA
ncbi:MAG TPA: hypothetical protein VHN15_04150 [Thermoanaerobaculia bacterium]|nr:hypothetical protein [Thermoanaerobaculia bacterium]